MYSTYLNKNTTDITNCKKARNIERPDAWLPNTNWLLPSPIFTIFPRREVDVNYRSFHRLFARKVCNCSSYRLRHPEDIDIDVWWDVEVQTCYRGLTSRSSFFLNPPSEKNCTVTSYILADKLQTGMKIWSIRHVWSLTDHMSGHALSKSAGQVTCHTWMWLYGAHASAFCMWLVDVNGCVDPFSHIEINVTHGHAK